MVRCSAPRRPTRESTMNGMSSVTVCRISGVSGSLVTRTLMGAEDIEAQAKPNIYEAIRELPSLMGSQMPLSTGGTRQPGGSQRSA